VKHTPSISLLQLPEQQSQLTVQAVPSGKQQRVPPVCGQAPVKGAQTAPAATSQQLLTPTVQVARRATQTVWQTPPMQVWPTGQQTPVQTARPLGQQPFVQSAPLVQHVLPTAQQV